MTHVSIVTITQHKRFESLKILYNIIQRQNYLQIKEWVIVEGSQDIELHNENIKCIREFINEKQDQTDIEMNLVYNNEIIPLSNLRNLGNDNCSGEIIVCMDDDDYYHREYIPYIVGLFKKYNRLIAGTTKMYMYDYKYGKIYKCKGFHNNHSTNNCLSYKKEYLKNHRYTEGLHMAEEYSFTNGFSEPMIQLNPDKSIITSIHSYNTVDKREFISKYNCIDDEIDKNISNMIPKEIFERMKRVFIES
jgi:glycosyltransferase involved in cell wall biosynthesis